MKCPKCGAENPEDHKFCSQCGSPLEQKHRCSCGAELPEGALFCPECGKKVENKLLNIENGHEWVDLGLPSGLKWATCNVGAKCPEEYGDYFAWGETTVKGNYTEQNYCYHDNPTILPLNADSAHINWGSNWRMPTDDEWIELREMCKWEWCTQNKVSGYCVTGPNGKSIFLPAAGFRYDTYLNFAGSYGIYWSSSLNTYSSNGAYHINFKSSNVVRYDDQRRYTGQSVRPVCSSR